MRECPQNCSGRGFCQEGQVCGCDENFTGHACETVLCPNDCSPNGVCENGFRGKHCECFDGYRGRSDKHDYVYAYRLQFFKHLCLVLLYIILDMESWSSLLFSLAFTFISNFPDWKFNWTLCSVKLRPIKEMESRFFTTFYSGVYRNVDWLTL